MTQRRPRKPVNTLASIAVFFALVGWASACSPYFLVSTGIAGFFALPATFSRPRYPAVFAWMAVLLGVVMFMGGRALGPTEQERSEARQQAAERRAAEAADRAAAQAECERLAEQYQDQFAAVIQALETPLIASLKAECLGNGFSVEITVTNLWHVRVKQLRLQDAQILWEEWARIASPSEPDLARIRLVDLRGNEVGGSSWLAGSMVSVKD